VGVGLALGLKAQASMIEVIGTSFIPMYKVIGPFLFFVSLLLMVWGGFCLVNTVCLIVRDHHEIQRMWCLQAVIEHGGERWGRC
jgi:hypothetical protein